MKLLFNHNLSPRLVWLLADLYPNSQHVFLLEMDQEDDRVIWDYALQNDYTIVTRDSDYSDLSLVRGFPPKVIWIRCGNCSTSTIEGDRYSCVFSSAIVGASDAVLTGAIAVF